MNLLELRNLYTKTLLEDVIPFWERHAIDPAGGINSCIADDGTAISRDRWGWSQWRAVWVFSHLYGKIERKQQWLDIAQNIYGFVSRCGPLDNGHWPMLMDADGHVQRGYESILNDGFAIYGLIELWRASRQDELLATAMRTFRAVRDALSGVEVPPMFPYPDPPDRPAQVHALSMLFSQVFDELAQATGDVEVRQAADRHHRRVMDLFLRPGRGLIIEWLKPDGSEFPPPKGTAVVPGHAIESLWFQMHIARRLGDKAALDRATTAIRKHLEIGWDKQFGGLFLAVDADDRAEVGWPFAGSKLWWPHTEAMYGTLLAYEHCREPWCLEWHEKIRAWSYSHFPVPEHGEWRQRLDRHGRPLTDVVALPVKDPFHLPRALMLCIECLDRIEYTPTKVRVNP